MKFAILIITLILTLQVIAAEKSIKEECTNKLVASFQAADQDLDRNFKGFYMCSAKGRELQKKSYETTSKIKLVGYMAAITTLGKTKKMTLRNEVVNACSSLEQIVAEKDSKKTPQQVGDEIFGCHIDGWPYAQSSLLLQIIVESLESENDPKKINDSEGSKEVEGGSKSKSKSKDSGAIRQ